MPKRKSIERTTPTKVYLNEANMAQLLALTYEPVVHRNRYGEVSRIINDALALYFTSLKEQPECLSTAKIPKSASTS